MKSAIELAFCSLVFVSLYSLAVFGGLAWVLIDHSLSKDIVSDLCPLIIIGLQTIPLMLAFVLIYAGLCIRSTKATEPVDGEITSGIKAIAIDLTESKELIKKLIEKAK